MAKLDTTEIAIRDIHHNPFRQIATYGLIETKLEELQASIHKTGFWPNVIGRRNTAGQVEIAYGHHRLEACKREYGEDHKLPIHLQDISDDFMLIIMADENSDDWANASQHARLVAEQAKDMLERVLDEAVDNSGDPLPWPKFYKKYASRPEILRAFDPATFGNAFEQGVSISDVGRYLQWGKERERGKWDSSSQLRNVWPLLPLSDRRRAYKEAQEQRLAAERDEAERKELEELRKELEADDTWEVDLIDSFKELISANAFREAVLEHRSGPEMVLHVGWAGVLKAAKAIDYRETKTKPLDLDDPKNPKSLIISTKAATRAATIQAISQWEIAQIPDEEERDEQETYEIYQQEIREILGRAKNSLGAATTNLNKAARKIGEHGMNTVTAGQADLVRGKIHTCTRAMNALKNAISDYEAASENALEHGTIIEGEYDEI